MERFWSLEEIGIRDNAYQADDEKALQVFNDKVKLVDNRYEVVWPWKDFEPDLPSNFGLAVGRLKSLLTRIKDQPSVLDAYEQTLADQVQKGIIERVEKSTTTNRIHYIPHHCVIKPDRTTTKLRIVYDASAKCGKTSPSLNECLLKGPIILQDLAGMLLRFRLCKIAMTCDIEKAFHQVGLQLYERDVTRFLWLRDPTKPITDSNLIIYRFCRVPFGVISSPFLLAATIQFHLSQQNSAVASDISSNIYVDNVLMGKNCLADAVDFYHTTKKLFSSISMNIREWFSNSLEFCKIINCDDQGKESATKVLGLKWHLQSDTLSSPALEIINENLSTKRQLLKTISAIYDPCGYFSPVTIRGKLIIQNIWKEKLPWDAQLPDHFLRQFQEVVSDLRSISEVKLPRLLNVAVPNPHAVHEIHCFCDASAKAYAAAVYLRSITPEAGTFLSLLFSKARLAPIKTVTLPRLELMAVVVGVRISEFVKKELRLPIHKVFVWTDSKCVLHWINSNKVLSVFVQNRVREIKRHSFQHRYVPTGCNPADIPSRGAVLQEIQDLWWQGPKFLLLKENMWPEDEFRIGFRASEVEPEGIGNVMAVENFSSLMRLFRVTGWVMRFIALSLRRTRRVEIGPSLTTDEIANAERLWVLSVQSKAFVGLLASKQSSPIVQQLGVFRDDCRLLRCCGRLKFASLSEDARQPMLLPKNNHFTDLVIKDCHQRIFHAGVSQGLSQVRYKYWIPHGRSQVQRLLRKCRICRKFEGGPFKVPHSPPLPPFRVSQCFPFSYIGIDYVGPLFVKMDAAVDCIKVWICLFTCAATRAIHLEVVTDMSTDQFIMCLRRFASIYGKPKLIVSDNAKTFKAADRFIKFLFKATATWCRRHCQREPPSLSMEIGQSGVNSCR